MDGVVVRRVFEADNSCLFNAVGYVMERQRGKAAELRRVIASIVTSKRDEYTEAVLEKPNDVYAAWILKDESWGGAIELSILADFYQRKIAAFDIKTTRCDLYAQDKGYKETVMLVYDGIHYDALAVAPTPDAPEDFDMTVLTASEFEAAAKSAAALVKKLQTARAFTDTGSFSLRCGICFKGLTGQKEAVEHARATGHGNFQEV